MNSTARIATFLFTDLEGSTPLWEKRPEQMRRIAPRHDAIVRQAIEAHGGKVVKSTGDGFHAIFDSVAEGAAAAVAGQQAIIEEPWPDSSLPIRVRMGLHTGESREREGDYYGAEVNRAARVMGIAHGGQILLSGATAALLRTALPPQVTLDDLGKHRLRGLAVDEQIYQLCHPSLPAGFPPLNSVSARRNNLPAQLSSFVGRKKEVADVVRLLGESRLLTLLGPGGTGKTRLMLEVAEELIGEFRDGVWLVELAPLSDPDLIPAHVAGALGIQEQPGREMRDGVVDFLRHKEPLLLLDNVEHLVRESATITEHLLRHCPELKILVTGREALFVSGEVTLQIPSLTLPSSNGEIDLDEIAASEGVQLFVARAQDVRPNFELEQANAAAIAEIVRRLDGIPFALELAAARIRMLSAEQIASRLNDRFRLLTGGRRTALPRQQTLQAMIDWSWNLLDDEERLLLQRLSVFTGGWSLEAAQFVAGDGQLDEYEVFNFLEQLVNKSLVTVTYLEGGEARYGTLESIRQYGRDRLFESEEAATIRDRHADYYLMFAEEAAPHLLRSTMLNWTERIKLEMDNLRSVLAWTLDDRPETALRISGALLNRESHWLTPREAQLWLEPVIEKTRALLDLPDSKVSAPDFIRALIGLAWSRGWQGHGKQTNAAVNEAILLARSSGEDLLLAHAIGFKYVQNFYDMSDEDMQLLADAVQILRDEGDEAELVIPLSVYGLALRYQGVDTLAESTLKEVIEIVGRLDNPRYNAGAFLLQSQLEEMRGDLEEAKKYRLLSIENFDRLNDRRSVIGGKSNHGHILRRQGAFEEAERYYRSSIVGWQEMGQLAAVAHVLECIAYVDIGLGRFSRAAKLLGAATETRRKLDTKSVVPMEIEDLENGMQQLAEELGEEMRDALLVEGSRLELDDAVLLAVGQG